MKMLSLFLLFVFLFSSCEKVVTIDLNSTDPRPVVEANISSEPGPYIVKLSKTANYYDSNTFPAITGAGVVVSDNAGNSETLAETYPGIYKTSSLAGTMGKTYTLKVSANGKDYTATSSMPYNVLIDSVLFQKNGGGGPGNPNSNLFPTYRVVCKFKDPAGIANFYMLQVLSNDTLGVDQSSIRILSDKLQDGTELSLTYRTRLYIGDSVLVKLKCIDKATYDFYNTLQNATGSSSFLSSLPANPTNNISNGGLGYFSAYSVSTKTDVVH